MPINVCGGGILDIDILVVCPFAEPCTSFYMSMWHMVGGESVYLDYVDGSRAIRVFTWVAV